MISLGAIEGPLGAVFPDVDQKKAFAVESCVVKGKDGSEEPKIGALLLRECAATKAEAEKMIQKALSTVFKGRALNLHLPDDVIFVEAIPILGTGKLDLQGCKAAVAAYYANKEE